MPQLGKQQTTLKDPQVVGRDTSAPASIKYDSTGTTKDIVKGLGNVADVVSTQIDNTKLAEFRDTAQAMRDVVLSTEQGSDRDRTIQQLDLGSKGPVFRKFINDFKRLRGKSLQMGTGTSASEYAANTGEALLKQFVNDNPDLGSEAVAVMKSILGIDPTGASLKYASRLEAENLALKNKREAKKQDNLNTNMLKYKLDSTDPKDRALYLNIIKPNEDRYQVLKARLNLMKVSDEMTTIQADNFIRDNVSTALLDVQIGVASFNAKLQQRLRNTTDPQEILKINQEAAKTYADMEQNLDNTLTKWKMVISSGDVNEIATVLQIDREEAKTLLNKVKARGSGALVESMMKNPEIAKIRAEIKAGREVYSDHKLMKDFTDRLGATGSAMLTTAAAGSTSLMKVIIVDKFLPNILGSSYSGQMLDFGRSNSALEHAVITMKDDPNRFTKAYVSTTSVEYDPTNSSLNDKRRDKAISQFAQDNGIDIPTAEQEFKLTELTTFNTGITMLKNGDKDPETINKVATLMGKMWSASQDSGTPTYSTKERGDILKNISVLPMEKVNALLDTIGTDVSMSMQDVADSITMQAFDKVGEQYGDTNFTQANIIFNPNNGSVNILSPVLRGTSADSIGHPIPTKDLANKLSYSFNMLVTALKTDYHNRGLTDQQIGQLAVQHLQANGFSNVSYGNPFGGNL